MAHGLMRELEVLGFKLLPHGPARPAGDWQPQADVFVTPEKVVVILEAAGLEASNIEVSYRAGNIILRGFRPRPTRGYEPRSFLTAEIPHGFFERVIPLPVQCNAEGITAVYRDGLVMVEAPLAPSARSREIPIEPASG